MVTVVYKVITKKGSEEEFKKITLVCTKCAHESKDCLYYAFFRALENPREFLVYYRFKTKEAQDKHIKNLQKKLGPAPTDRDLPFRFLNLLDNEEVILFKTN